MRVGGRLERTSESIEERHPLVLPASHHAVKTLVEHVHNDVKYQGRQITQGKKKTSATVDG